jgi:type III restriction enzyme
MGLDKTFPKSPYSILHPTVRWFPGEDVADPQSLMPPLVPKVREAVYKWREDGYLNVSDVTKALLKHWFVNGHESAFQYYFAQRESVESIIYLYEVEKIRHPSELLRFDSSGVLVESMFDEQWVRLVAKQATGTGKTKVLSLLIVWAYFHKLYVEDSELSQNFLLLAPNTIVLDRLKTDIEGLRVFRSDPALPPNNYEGRMWNSDFNPKIHIQDNIGSISKTGNIFLTNIQRFSNRTKSTDKNSSIDYFLGEKPVAKTSDNKITVKDIVKNLDNLIVLNDEAHHIHDSNMAWFKTIENIHSSIRNMPIQIDVTATPKNQNGEIFIQTISDYPLVEAIEQDVVKKPILPDEASLGKLSEHDSSKFSERWRDYIDLGVTVWQQDYEKHKKLEEGKKALLFIMVDDTKNCDEVRDYLENSYPILKNSTFVIHTNKEGEIDENTSSKSQSELMALRDMANRVDSNDNEIKAIISVLMLKEGWDVRNVTTVVGLRPFSGKANILPEQALGRGLRKMYFGSGFQEELNVVGSEGFIEFVKSIKREGVMLEERSMGKGSEASGPTIIEVDKTKDIKDLDIEIPVLTNRIQRDYKNLDLLDPDTFEFKRFTIHEFTAEEQKNIVFRDIIHDEVMKEVKLSNDLIINGTSIISFFTNSIMQELRLYGGKDILYGKVKHFIKDLLFGQTVNLENPNIARNLSESNVRETIKRVFKDSINRLTVVDKGETEVINHIKISNVKTFAVARTLETFNNPQKSLFNKIVGDSHFELQFAGFLDATVDVKAFVKNFQKLNFQMTYQKHDGSIGSYFPDFTVKLKNGDFFVVETKGAEDLDDPRKIARLKVWCEDATKAESKNWNCLYVKQEEWERLGQIPNSFAEIVDLFKVK